MLKMFDKRNEAHLDTYCVDDRLQGVEVVCGAGRNRKQLVIQERHERCLDERSNKYCDGLSDSGCRMRADLRGLADIYGMWEMDGCRILTKKLVGKSR